MEPIKNTDIPEEELDVYARRSTPLDVNTKALTAAQSGASPLQIFGGINPQTATAINEAFEASTKRSDDTAISKSIKDRKIGMGLASSDARVQAIAKNLREVYGDDEFLVKSLDEVTSENQTKDVKDAVIKILMSDSSIDSKRNSIKFLASKTTQKVDDTTAYAIGAANAGSDLATVVKDRMPVTSKDFTSDELGTAQAKADAANKAKLLPTGTTDTAQSKNQRMAITHAIATAERVVQQIKGGPVGIMQTAVDKWTKDKSIMAWGSISSLAPMYTPIRMNRVFKTLGYGNDNSAKSAVSTEDNIKAWESAYELADRATQQAMVIDAVKTIEDEAAGDTIFARYALDYFFKPTLEHTKKSLEAVIYLSNNPKDPDAQAIMLEVDSVLYKERKSRLLWETGLTAVDSAGALVDAGSILRIGKAFGGAAIEGMAAVAAIKAALPGITTADSVSILMTAQSKLKGVIVNEKELATRALQEAAKAVKETKALVKTGQAVKGDVVATKVAKGNVKKATKITQKAAQGFATQQKLQVATNARHVAQQANMGPAIVTSIRANTSTVSNFTPGSAVDIDIILNPNKARAKLLDDFNGKGDPSYGTNPAVTTSRTVLPRAADDVIRDVPNLGPQLGMSPAYDEMITQSLSRFAAQVGPNHYAYRAGELVNVASRAHDEVVDVFRTTAYGNVNVNMSAQIAVDNGYISQFVVTSGGKNHFSADDAVKAANIYGSDADTFFRLLIRDDATGNWLTVANPPKLANGSIDVSKMPKGEYALGVVKHATFKTSDAVGDDVVRDGHLGAWSAQVDKSTMITKDIADTSTVAELKNGVIKSILADANRAFSALGGANARAKRRSQSRVMDALYDGAGYSGRPGALLDSADLVKLGLNPEEMTAYYHLRARFDLEYMINNKAYRADLVKNGYTKQIELGGIVHKLKPVKPDALKGATHVVDVNGNVVPLTPAWQGTQPVTVLRMNSAINQGGINARHLVIRTQDVNAAKTAGRTLVEELDDYVLPYHKGYVPRAYDTSYIVTKTTNSVDEFGKAVEFEEAVATSRTLDAALEFAKQNGINPDVGVRLAREVMRRGAGVFDKAAKKRTDYGGVIFGRRGDKLVDAEEIGHLAQVPQIDATRNLKNIADVLATSSRITAQRQTMDAVVNAHIDRWNAKFGKFGDKDNPWTLATVKAMKDNIPPSLNGVYREAMAYREHIAMLQGADETLFNSRIASIKQWVANSLARGAWPVPKSTAQKWEYGLRHTINQDASSLFKRANFVMYMGLNPTSQLVLQASQTFAYIGLDGGTMYVASGRATRDWYSLMVGMQYKDDVSAVGRAMWNSAVKASGKTDQELGDMILAFERSGIMQGVDRHQYMDAVVSTQLATDSIGTGVGDYARSALDMLRKVGFNAGESINQTNAWLFARQRYLAQKTKGVKSLHELDTSMEHSVGVAVMARNIAGNMDTSARLKHQDGLLGMITQFASYGTKMTQMMMPREIAFIGDNAIQRMYFNTFGRFGSDIYTAREKLRITTQQLGFWGLGGTSVGGIVTGSSPIVPGTDWKLDKVGHWLTNTFAEDYGLDLEKVPFDVRDALVQGFNGAVLNAVFSAIYDEDVQANWTTKFAPIGGLSTSAGKTFELINSIIDGDTMAVTHGLGGVSVMQMDRLLDASSSLVGWGSREVVALSQGYAKPESVHEWPLFYDKLARLIPVLNNIEQGKYALEVGYFKTASGSHTVATGKAEAHLRMALGLRPLEELPLMMAKNSMEGFFGETKQGDADGVRRLANATWKQIKLHQAALNNNDITYEQFLDLASWYTTLQNTVLNDVERRQLRNYLADKHMKEQNKNLPDAIVGTMLKHMKKATLSLSDARSYIMTTPDFEGKQELYDALKFYENEHEKAYGKDESFRLDRYEGD